MLNLFQHPTSKVANHTGYSACGIPKQVRDDKRGKKNNKSKKRAKARQKTGPGLALRAEGFFCLDLLLPFGSSQK